MTFQREVKPLRSLFTGWRHAGGKPGRDGRGRYGTWRGDGVAGAGDNREWDMEREVLGRQRRGMRNS